jgi:hypothetical protein
MQYTIHRHAGKSASSVIVSIVMALCPVNVFLIIFITVATVSSPASSRTANRHLGRVSPLIICARARFRHAAPLHTARSSLSRMRTLNRVVSLCVRSSRPPKNTEAALGLRLERYLHASTGAIEKKKSSRLIGSGLGRLQSGGHSLFLMSTYCQTATS